jgi:restriction endonuclease S subunit
LVGIFDEDRSDVSFPDTMMRLPVNESIVSKQFLEAVLQSERGRQHMMRSAAGTSGSMKKINRRTLGTCIIPTPLPEVQSRLMSRVDGLRTITDSADAVRRRANDMKKALIEATWGNHK